jgi:hypothetical protein
MGRIGRIQTDFFNFLFKNQAELKEKSVSIRPIRSPIASQQNNIFYFSFKQAFVCNNHQFLDNFSK